MCAQCGWLDVAGSIMANLETRDRAQHTTHILAVVVEIILSNQHVTPDQADAIEAIGEREGWAA